LSFILQTHEMKKATLLLLLSILIFLGCTKEKIIEIPVPVDKQYRWKLDSNFLYNNSIIANSFATENELYLYGKYFSVLTYDKNSKEKVENYTLRGEPNTNFKMPISPSFFINTYQNTVIFIPTQGPVTEYNTSYQRFGYVNPNLVTTLAFPSYDFGQCMAINKKNQALIPYTSYDPTTNLADGNIFYFLLADINVINDGQRSEIAQTKTVTIQNDGPYMSSLFTHKDYFVAYLRKNYKIYSDGKVKQIAPNYALKKVFQKSDTLYAFSPDGSILRSTNDAEDWIKLGTGNTNLAYTNYYLVNNEVIGTYFSQLFHFKIDGNNITIKEIDNDGLVTRYITSISKFKDKVFVTTLTGVYTVDYKDFFKYK
jgi:hypothetical protein